MERERLEARIEALEWVIQAALTAALGSVDRQQQRRGELADAVLRSVSSGGQTPAAANVAQEPPHLLSVNDTAKALGISRNTVYELIRMNDLPSIQIGRRRLVPRSLMLEWVVARAQRTDDRAGL